MDTQHADVRSLRSVLAGINARPGLDADRSLLVGQAVLCGSHAYATSDKRYSFGSFGARCVESVYIGRALEDALSEIGKVGLPRASLQYCDDGKIETMLRIENPQAIVLNKLRSRLLHKNADYRTDRLTDYGERVLHSATTRAYLGMPNTRATTQVSLAKLDEEHCPPLLKQMQKELRMLEELALRL